MSERIEQCETCKWWDSLTTQIEFGYCCKHPPILCETIVAFFRDNPDEDEQDECVEHNLLATVRGPNPWCQPVTVLDDFCGEWQPTTVGATADQ